MAIQRNEKEKGEKKTRTRKLVMTTLYWEISRDLGIEPGKDTF